ncbi:hypothetical protein ACRS85_21665 [Pluralibacter gergoviae]|uniref:hypothetical protein n=1 Tax=Pluralibacter gergoviae TaxID=61647 RepID=UPI003EE1E3A6
MAKVYLLTKGFRHSAPGFIGAFSTLENARQRQREILENTPKELYPDFYRIDSALLDIGELVTEEITRFDNHGNKIA